jgi:transposase-like protein
MRKLVAVFWVLGLSLRGVTTLLGAFRVPLSHMTVWRDLQEQTELLEKQRRWQGVRVLGLDGAYVQGWDKRKHPVLVAVDLGRGQPVAVGYVDEYNPQAVRRFLEPLVQRLGVSVIVTDDLASFRRVTVKLGVEHQVCQFHLRRWVGRTLRELQQTVPKDWLWVLDEVKGLLEELPPEGSRRLYELWKQIPERRVGQSQPLSPLSQLRDLLIRLSEHWPNYRVFDWDKDVPWTNNGTERVIGRMKMRSRTVRGYKSWPGMHAALMLAGSSIAW